MRIVSSTFANLRVRIQYRSEVCKVEMGNVLLTLLESQHRMVFSVPNNFPSSSYGIPCLVLTIFRSDCTEQRGHVASPLVQTEPPARHQLLQLDGQPPCFIKHLERRPSRNIHMRIRPLPGFGSMYAPSQCPPASRLPVKRIDPNRALSRRILQGTFVLRLLRCRPGHVRDTRSASLADTLVPFQPSRVYSRLSLSLPASCRLNALSRRMACLKLTRTTGNPRTSPSSLQIPGGHRLQGSWCAGVEEAVHDLTTIDHNLRSDDRIGSLGVLGCKSMRAIDAFPNRLSRTDALLLPGPAPIRPGVSLTHDMALAADENIISDP
ncbi:hypothetical protein T05_8277 [Trichinella murrelli]|uniref:Uncharacterized protein n=1 Tax=Trichinella murrelli TaxID=144512 RepID=A0A0V0T409_9BILA|nr:hypothetical protein T05_8277 [Trichinella murrelli]